MKLVYLSVFCLFFCFNQLAYTQSDNISLQFSIEPYFGLSQVKSEINSNDYFRRYEPTYKSTYLFGIDGELKFSSNLSVISGLRLMNFWAGTDYLDISPLDID